MQRLHVSNEGYSMLKTDLCFLSSKKQPMQWSDPNGTVRRLHLGKWDVLVCVSISRSLCLSLPSLELTMTQESLRWTGGWFLLFLFFASFLVQISSLPSSSYGTRSYSKFCAIIFLSLSLIVSLNICRCVCISWPSDSICIACLLCCRPSFSLSLCV